MHPRGSGPHTFRGSRGSETAIADLLRVKWGAFEPNSPGTAHTSSGAVNHVMLAGTHGLARGDAFSHRLKATQFEAEVSMRAHIESMS